jgi:MFS family permease
LPSIASRALQPDVHRDASSPLAYRDFRLLWLGSFVSQIGNQMQIVAISWQVNELTHDPLALGAVGFARVLPVIVLGVFGGVIADAVDRRRLMLLTQTTLMAVAIGLFAFSARGQVNVAILYGFCLLGGAATALDNPARQATIANLVPPSVLPRALSLGVTTWQLATVLGPTIGGFLIASRGAELVYVANALSFAGILGALLAIRYRGARAALVRPDLAALREGFRFLWRTPILLSLMLLDFLGTFFAGAMLLMPIFASDLLSVGPSGLGVLFAAPAVGSVLAAALISVIGSPPLAGFTVLWSVALYGVAIAGFGAARSFPVALACLALSGAADAVSTVVRQTLRQLLTPDELRGRMTATNMIFFMGGPLLGELEAGALARLTTVRFSVISGGVICTALSIAFAIAAPRLRRYRLKSLMQAPVPADT